MPSVQGIQAMRTSSFRQSLSRERGQRQEKEHSHDAAPQALDERVALEQLALYRARAVAHHRGSQVAVQPDQATQFRLTLPVLQVACMHMPPQRDC